MTASETIDATTTALKPYKIASLKKGSRVHLADCADRRMDETGAVYATAEDVQATLGEPEPVSFGICCWGRQSTASRQSIEKRIHDEAVGAQIGASIAASLTDGQAPKPPTVAEKRAAKKAAALAAKDEAMSTPPTGKRAAAKKATAPKGIQDVPLPGDAKPTRKAATKKAAAAPVADSASPVEDRGGRPVTVKVDGKAVTLLYVERQRVTPDEKSGLLYGKWVLVGGSMDTVTRTEITYRRGEGYAVAGVGQAGAKRLADAVRVALQATA